MQLKSINMDQSEVVSKKRGRPIKIDEKRFLIINTAKQCFKEKGYDLTTLDFIAQKIGFNKSAFYYYFQDKESLFLETVMDEIEFTRNKFNPSIIKEFSYELLFEYIKARTLNVLNICKIHKLKRTDALKVTLSFNKLNKNFILNEIEFLKMFIHFKNKSKFSETQLDYYSNLFYHVLFSFTNTELLINHIHNNEDLSKKHIDEKIKLAELFLKGLEKI